MKTNTMSSEFLEVTIAENLSEAGISPQGTLDPHPWSTKKEDASDMQVGDMDKLLESASGMQSDDLKGMVGDMPPLDKSKKETNFSCSDVHLKGIKKKGENSGPQLSKHGDNTQYLANEQLEDGVETQVIRTIVHVVFIM